MNPIITFTTDFGQREHYVGTMKGVLLSINPAVQLVDICNDVSSFDLLDGALTIAQAYSYYPADTIHVVVVDPGVGTARRPILAVTSKHRFVAPDNGVLSLVFEREERVAVYHINATHYFLQPVSNTFHGRDIFAPIAAYLSKGVEPAKLGTEIQDYVRFTMPKPKPTANGLTGAIIRVDKFGNLGTNITAADAPQLFNGPSPTFRLRVGKGEVTKLQSAFAQGAAGEAFAIVGSMGYLEIAAHRASAAQLLAASRGSEVVVEW